MTCLQAGYGLDGDGYIISDVHIDKIHSIFLPLIHDSIKEIGLLFPNQLHSVYVYGSVARGEAIINKLINGKGRNEYL
ncbi:hypothetical protein ACFQ38_00825 [Sporosarcina contaminans]|uniref:Nucleotidyltransferase domain-containing protein n=1 Tax=Sporosarcina contaminans TaxID=633403 RepID=A0ABW3TSF4_9BACL